MIRAIFENVWKECVVAYRAGRINSERTLQALMFAGLSRDLPELVVLCEPRLEASQFGPVLPDIVVVSDAEIVAIAELKFVPHSDPVFEGDLGKLARCATCNYSFSVLCDPASGKIADGRHTIAPECLFVFGVIGHHRSKAVCEKVLTQHFSDSASHYAGRFLPLTYAVGANPAGKENGRP